MQLNMQRAPILKMAVNRAKQERKIPSFIDKCVEAKTKQCKKIKTTDKDIYPVEITQVEKARNMLKIHFKGFSEIYDEWRPCNEYNLPVMRLESMSQRASSRFYICPWRWQQMWIKKYGPSLICLI